MALCICVGNASQLKRHGRSFCVVKLEKYKVLSYFIVMLSSLASATKGFNQKLFFFSVHKILFTRSIITMAGTGVSSSPAYSTSSPSQAPLKRVGTHNGSFHCDEALGCFMIRLTDKFFNAQIVRSRDPKVLLIQTHFTLICL